MDWKEAEAECLGVLLLRTHLQVADGDGLLKAVNMMIMKLLEQASRWVHLRG
mgnify:CR=1 FL=1